MNWPSITFGRGLADGKFVKFVGDSHVMTIAPTGAGKGATSIIPNLLKWPDSVFVIDPKGENVTRTITARHNLNQGRVYLLDPFEVVDPSKRARQAIRARFNPLDFIELGEGGITQADRLADALIIKEGNEQNAYFTNEARALLKALILHVKSDRLYHGRRNLGTVNEIASNPVKLIGEQKGPDGEMQANHAFDGLVERTAIRMKAKGDREGPAVWSTLQANLSQFLDDPRIAYSLAETTEGFDFVKLTQSRISVFAVLPVQYLETFNRWLRLLVGSALDRLYSTMSEKPPPVSALFLLDEFAHLGNMEAIKTAYGVARGAGVKIWAILQSLSQLDMIYGNHGRENLIANSGAIEVFNMFDNTGCKYFSEMAGEQYIEIKESSETNATSNTDSNQPGSQTESHTVQHRYKQDKRPRLLPAEISDMNPNNKILFLQESGFEVLHKMTYFGRDSPLDNLWDRDR